MADVFKARLAVDPERQANEMYFAPFSDETTKTLDAFADQFAGLAAAFAEAAERQTDRASRRFFDGYTAAYEEVTSELRSLGNRRLRRAIGNEPKPKASQP